MNQSHQAQHKEVSFDLLPSLVTDLLNSVATLQQEVIELKKTPKATSTEFIPGTELRKRFGISKPTETRWRRSGKIPYLLTGGRFRYDYNAVLTAIQGNKKREV